MTEPDRRQRLIDSTPRLSPEEVATRSFSTRVRGYGESEVRSFLGRVAEEMVAARAREQELLSAMDALEEQLRQPRPLSEQELLDGLGEETARLLRSGREAGEEIRKKGEERAARMVDEANAIAESTRAEAEAHSSQLLDTAEARARELASAAEAESDAIVEGARRRGREMLDEAKAARERVLADLVRRRALLQGQIEALRVGRDRLLDAYRTVKGTFLEATEALAQVEARSVAERSATVTEPFDLAAEIAAEIEALDDAAGDATQVVDVVAIEIAESPEMEAVDAAVTPDADDLDDGSGGALADVDSLFARIRAGHADAPSDAAAPGGAPAEEAATSEASEAPAPDAGAESEPAPAREPISAAEWRELQERQVDGLLGPLVKKTKRTVQDDQNALLDAVRRHKGRPAAAQVLPDLDALITAWSRVLGDAVDHAYADGRVAAGGEARDADPALVREAAEAVVAPLRQRVTVAIDSGDEGDTGGLVERIGARYREWKNQSLESSLAEALAFVWSRGVYDAVPDGEVLWWVPNDSGRCSDCDDNGLQPTVKGELFPTGQPFPPAHPGCRCLLAPAVMHTPTETTGSNQ